jgi:Xaa-Pro dipeptidase
MKVNGGNRMYKKRLNSLNQRISEQNLDAVLLLPGSNLQYLTGLSFHLMERPILLIITPGQKPLLIVPILEREKAEKSELNIKLHVYQKDLASRDAAFNKALSYLGKGTKRVGVEPLGMRFHELSMLQSIAAGWDFVSAGTSLSELRIRKSESEVEFMREAVIIAEKAIQGALPQIRVGMSEREVASELILQLIRAGSEPNLPFDPVVASGPNSALPHATPSDRKLQPGDLLKIDWGARVAGYISDLTRTFALQELNPELETIHLIVQQANDAGRDAVKPGAICSSVDKEARNVIEAAGYGEFFIHSTGHGIGLQVHEAPYIHPDIHTELAMGMTFTVEPGIYLPGRGGIRIEDNMVVTESGGESLSHLDRSLQILGG